VPMFPGPTIAAVPLTLVRVVVVMVLLRRIGR